MEFAAKSGPLAFTRPIVYHTNAGSIGSRGQGFNFTSYFEERDSGSRSASPGEAGSRRCCRPPVNCGGSMTMLHARPSQSSADPENIGSAPSITTALPGPIAKGLIDRDERYSSPSYTRDYPLVVKRARGVVIEDVDGNRFLDFAAGIAVCATGHCHPQVVAAIEKQARELIHICGSDFYYPSMVELLEKLEKITPGAGEKKVLLTNSGAESVEAAFKLARHHTNRKYAISF